MKKKTPAKETSFVPDLDDDRLTFSSDDDSANEEGKGNHEELPIDEDEGSDSSPEEVTFKSSEEVENLLKKQAAQLAKIQNEIVKQKRAAMHLRNVLQKEEKERKLNMKKLPDEVLVDIEDMPSSTGNAQIPQPVKTVLTDKSEDLKGPEAQSSKECLIGKTKFQVKNLKKELQKPYFMRPDITDFKTRMMYRKNNHREASSQSYFARLEKKNVGSNK